MRKEVFRTKSMVNRCICFEHLIRSASIVGAGVALKFVHKQKKTFSAFGIFPHPIIFPHLQPPRMIKVIMFAYILVNARLQILVSR